MRGYIERSIVADRLRGRASPLWRVLTALALLVAAIGVLPWASNLPGARAQEAIIALPSAPGPAAPADGALLADAWDGVELQWTAVPDALEYQVILNDGQRTSPWVTGTAWSPGTLPEGDYQWAVRARNEAGAGQPGPISTFTVVPDGATVPAPDSAAAPEGFEPLPLEQRGGQGQDGVESASGDPNMTGVVTDPASAPGSAPAPVAATDAATAGTPVAAGTPVPVVEHVDSATPEEKPDKKARKSAEDAPPAEAAPAAEDAPPAEDALVVPAADSDSGNDNERDGGGDKREPREKRERKDREPKGRYDSNGNGGVSEVVAAPPEYRSFSYQIPEELQSAAYQQDAANSTASGAGEDGTVNGQPRETADAAPPETVGPGAPGEVLLPPPVPGLPGAEAGAPALNPAAVPGTSGTTELGFDAVSDATVFLSSPGSPQSPESINYLAIGGSQEAVSLISFKVEGVGDGTVLAARLTFYGAGGAGAPGGSVGVIYDYVVPDGATANGVPSSETALNVHGAPAWFERVEPNGLTAVDVTGSVAGDGRITFVLPGQPEATGSLFALESGTPPQLLLTVALPA